MRAPTRIPGVVVLGAVLLLGACGDEPAPQHPTSSHSKKKHKKHADADVVVTDDADADDSDSTPAKSHRHHDTEVAAKDDDDAPKKKRHADAEKTDDEDAPKKSHKAAKKSDDDAPKKTDDEDAPKKSHKAAKKSDADEPKQSDDDEPPKKTHKTAKKSDDDEPKKAADEPAKSDDEPKPADDEPAKPAEPEHTAKREPKKPARRTTKKKRTAPAKTAKTEAPDTSGAGEIEMDEDPLAGGPKPETAEASTTGDDEPDAGAAVAAPMPTPAPTASPLAINDRALITRHGALEVHGGLRTGVLTLPGLMPGTSTSSTSEGLALGATYGAGEKLEVGADYVLSLSPGSVKGPLTFHGAYLAYARPKLDVAIAGGLAVDFQDSTDPTTMKTTTVTSFGLELGGWVRYRAAPKVTLFTGLPALPASTASLSKLSFALPPLPYQLAIGLSSGSAIALDVPVGVGVQAAPAIYVFAMTNLAHLKISNSANAFLFADFIPLTLGGFYSRDKLDLGATFADDLKQGTGYLSFVLLARYAIH